MRLSLVLFLLLSPYVLKGGEVRFHDLKFRLPVKWSEVSPVEGATGGQKDGLWRAPGGKELRLTMWPGTPERDGGAMVIEESYEIVVAGQRTRLLQTRFFMGVESRVLVVYLKRDERQYRIYGRNVSRKEFESMLSTLSFTGAP